MLGGHADSAGPDKSNDKLSEKRAELTHAMLTGDRGKFVDIAHETGKVSDWKQIFKWAVAAYPASRPPIPETSTTTRLWVSLRPLPSTRLTTPTKPKIGFPVADDLKPDGVVGKQTWGAIFDLD